MSRRAARRIARGGGLRHRLALARSPLSSVHRDDPLRSAGVLLAVAQLRTVGSRTTLLAEGDAGAGAAAVEAEDGPGSQACGIDVRIDAPTASPATQRRLAAERVGKAWPPHQRPVAKHPEVAVRGAFGSAICPERRGRRTGSEIGHSASAASGWGAGGTSTRSSGAIRLSPLAASSLAVAQAALAAPDQLVRWRAPTPPHSPRRRRSPKRFPRRGRSATASSSSCARSTDR